MSDADAADLEWIFGRGGAFVANDRSTFGAQLERQERYSTWGMRKTKELTARITAEVHVRDGYEPDGDALRRAGRIRTRLKALEESNDWAHQVLSRYYGDVGFRCAVEDGGRYGRIACLYPLVQAGRKMVVRAARVSRASKDDMSADELLMNELKVEGSQIQPARAQLIERARSQAHQLYEQAVIAWNATRLGE